MRFRVSSYYYTWCEICGESIAVASKKRVVKNNSFKKKKK